MTDKQQEARLNAERAVTKTYLPISLKQSLGILGSSLLLGVLSNYLLRAPQMGIGWTILVSTAILSFYLWKRQLQAVSPADKLSYVLLASITLMALLFSWRASSFLATLNIAVTLFLAGLLVARLGLAAFWTSSFPEIGVNLLLTVFTPLGSFVGFLAQSRWHNLAQHDTSSRAAVVAAWLRGLIVAIPLLLVFGVLLAAADATFETLLNGLFSLNLAGFIEHSFSTTLLTCIALALLTQALWGSPWVSVRLEAPALFSFGRTETAIVFGSLIALFSAFMLLQFSYLFGGEQLLSSSDVTYAEYGRRGFFELVTVTVLLHLVLLTGLWLVRSGKAAQLYQWLAAALVLLLYGVIWSAYQRLGLYIKTYGLTELRYYSSAMIIFIGVVMLYFLLRLFYKSAPRVAPSYIILGVLAVSALYISNPDARIAQVNLQRDSRQLDTTYFYSLSLDAAPVVETYLSEQPNSYETRQLKQIFVGKLDQVQTDWRSFNISRWHAAQIMTSSE